jgi:heptosyltransferase III
MNPVITKKEIKKILVIKLRGIGDVVCSTMVIDNLRNDFPKAQIDYLVEKPSSFGLLGIKQLNKVWIFNRKILLERIKLALAVRKENYDLVFDFFGNPSSAQLTFVSGAKYRVGFPLRGRKYAYNIFGPEERSTWHNAILHLKVLEKVGISNKHRNLLYSLDDTSKLFAEKYFSKTFSNDEFVVGICPTGSWESKKCDPGKFAEIAAQVIKTYNAKILILWGKGDEKDGEKLQKILGDKCIYAPPTSIIEMAALISHCKFLIANDSGPMHIATALGTPVLSLHGPTSPQLQGPYGEKHEWIHLSELHCIMCNLLECKYNHECFLNLPMEKIMEKIDSLVSKNHLFNL